RRLKVVIGDNNTMELPATPVRASDKSPVKRIVRTPVVILCAVALGLTLNLIAETNGRPAPPRGAAITSPAQLGALFAEPKAVCQNRQRAAGDAARLTRARLLLLRRRPARSAVRQHAHGSDRSRAVRTGAASLQPHLPRLHAS